MKGGKKQKGEDVAHISSWPPGKVEKTRSKSSVEDVGPRHRTCRKTNPEKITPKKIIKKRAVGTKGRKGEKDEWLKVDTIKLTFS